MSHPEKKRMTGVSGQCFWNRSYQTSTPASKDDTLGSEDKI